MRAKGLCNSCYTKSWLDSGTKREEHKIRTRNVYYKYKAEMIEAYGGACDCCGETEPVFLSLEHKNKNGAEHRRKTGSGFAIWCELRALGWPKEDYTVLCMNCQRGTLRPEGCPHKRIQ